jgi:hypothetical protein
LVCSIIWKQQLWKWNLLWNKRFVKDSNLMRKIKTLISLGKAPDFTKMNKAYYGLKREYVYQKSSTYANLF